MKTWGEGSVRNAGRKNVLFKCWYSSLALITHHAIIVAIYHQGAPPTEIHILFPPITYLARDGRRVEKEKLKRQHHMHILSVLHCSSQRVLPFKRPTHIVGCPPRFQCEIPLQMWSKGPFKVTDKTCHSMEFCISHQRSYGFQILREKEKCGIRSWQVQSSFFYPKAFLIPNPRDDICPHSFSYKNT